MEEKPKFVHSCEVKGHENCRDTHCNCVCHEKEAFAIIDEEESKRKIRM